jgi:hypothetical protein
MKFAATGQRVTQLRPAAKKMAGLHLLPFAADVRMSPVVPIAALFFRSHGRDKSE